MKVVAWARVSSKDQTEGYSIDAQLRAMRSKADKEGWQIAREFVVAESAKRGAERAEFNSMFRWVTQNARTQKLGAILSHKLDRVCRNMRDAVRLQELEDSCGVQLAFVENQFGPGAAGQLSFNVMAAVAQYYSDNLKTETAKGMDEKVRQGWLPGRAPFGYVNVPGNREQPIQPQPDEAATVVRIFELYARGNLAFRTLAGTLLKEGRIYSPNAPRFARTSLSNILNNRFYIGSLVWGGKVFPGKHRPLISHDLFAACQAILHGRNRRGTHPNLPYSNAVFRCAHCGSAATPERIRRRLRGGGVREHIYFKCMKNNLPNHPNMRWRLEDVEKAVEDDLARLRMPSAEVADWFEKTLVAVAGDLGADVQQRKASLARRRTQLKEMKDRLLNSYLLGSTDEATFQAKTGELQREAEQVQRDLDATDDAGSANTELALDVFRFSQNIVERWRGSNISARIEILNCLTSNRALGDVSIALTKRKPFDVLAEGPDLGDGVS